MATEEGQDFIWKIISEGTHYGWKNYGAVAGSDLSAETESDLIALAEEATKAAQALTRAEEKFFEAAQAHGYETEE